MKSKGEVARLRGKSEASGKVSGASIESARSLIGDIRKMTSRFDTQGGNPSGNTRQPAQRHYVARFDLNNDSFIDVIGDIQKVAGVYGAARGPPTTGPYGTAQPLTARRQRRLIS